jgi:hypothetical protein
MMCGLISGFYRELDEVCALCSWPFKMGPIGYPETLVRNHHCVLRNNAEERRCQVWNVKRALCVDTKVFRRRTELGGCVE